MAGKYPNPNDSYADLLKKIAYNTAAIADSTSGTDATITTGGLVGKTMTFVKGILNSFS